jgi:hypothetical protein
MSFGPESDRAVRDAVDAFLEGRLLPELPDEAWFDTRNSRYRLRGGALVDAENGALAGAELVGWLVERGAGPAVEARWSSGARAVLVDRQQGRHLVVTSVVRRFGEGRDDGVGSLLAHGGSVAAHAQPVAAMLASPPPLPARTPVPPPLPPIAHAGPPPLPPIAHAGPPPLPPLPPPDARAAAAPLRPPPTGSMLTLGARAAAALAAKGLLAPGVPLPSYAQRSPHVDIPPPPPSADPIPLRRALQRGAVLPSE